ncbi:MAG: glycosyltransferase family 87 protein [Corynebacterium sp.]|uniref:glycosyltransferase family 87 protein n=1 Tax=Corynebacterium sp. TaxID=1720 RepID=UPI0026DCDDE2|nr:glycosyltransferase family 87 protein [Corynebacterium sp.]MDO5099168.1 glycosyltransferase family 87 protein [Corynebacterium sp.]
MTKLQTMWAEPLPQQPSSDTGHNQAESIDHTGKAARLQAIGRLALWPLAIFLITHRVFILAGNGSKTDDFTTVYQALRRFLSGESVYNETYHFVDPHYLYNPGATLILSPLGLVEDPTIARIGFIVINALFIIGGLAILTRLFGHALNSVVFPAVIVIAFCTEAVINTLVFANINGILLCALCGFIWAILRDKKWLAGIILGIMILIKPVFAPLLLIPFVKFYWQTFSAAIGIPIIVNVLAWPVIPGASDYLHRTVPYLGEVRDYANSSFPGLAVYFGLNPWVKNLVFALFAAAVIIAVFFLLRLRNSDPLLWVSATSGVLLAGAFLLSSLGQMYYSMMLFPLLFTVFKDRSPMHSAAGWIGTILCLSPLDWVSVYFSIWGRWFNTFQATIGWAIIIAAVTAFSVAAFRRSKTPIQL